MSGDCFAASQGGSSHDSGAFARTMGKYPFARTCAKNNAGIFLKKWPSSRIMMMRHRTEGDLDDEKAMDSFLVFVLCFLWTIT